MSGAPGDGSNARPAAYKAAALPAELRGLVCIHFGCARARASRRTWCLAARGLAKDRAHPGPPTPCRVATECKDTPEVERMTGLEPMSWPWRGLALPIELHPQKVQGMPSASTEAALRQLVKERPPGAAVRSVDRSRPAPMRKLVGFGKTKRPGSFRSPGLCVQSFEGAQLRASLSRMHSVLAPIKLRKGAWLDRRKGRMQSRATRPERSHRRRPWQLRCERDQTLHGSVGSDGVVGIHDCVLGTSALTESRFGKRQGGL